MLFVLKTMYLIMHACAEPCCADSPESPTSFAEPCRTYSPDSPTFAEPCRTYSPDSPTFTEPCCADSPYLPTLADTRRHLPTLTDTRRAVLRGLARLADTRFGKFLRKCDSPRQIRASNARVLQIWRKWPLLRFSSISKAKKNLVESQKV